MFYVYIVRCADDSFYTGYTNNLTKRVSVHNSGKGAKYTRVRLPVVIVYSESYKTKSEALKRESYIKTLSRKNKVKLVLEMSDCNGRT
jgi:putative endonuclease